MKGRLLLLLLWVAISGVVCGLPDGPDAPECEGQSRNDRWRKDCNWCSCRDGKARCSRRLCAEGQKDAEPPCEGNPAWKDDCNSCRCVDGRAVCTSKFCGQLGPQVETTHTVEVQSVQGECENGSRWRVECNWCSCQGGKSHCTEAACVNWNESQAEEQGILECHGASRWKKDCNWCSCVNGRGRCTKRGCIPAERDSFHNLPDNAQCVPGSRWLVDCNWCSCADNGLYSACTLMACVPGYVHEGPTCSAGAVWKSDDCNTCRCIDGVSACTKRLCATPDQQPQVPQVPEEPQCQGEPGTDRWRSDCNWCSCRNGVGTCTRRLCPPGMKDEQPECEGNPSWMKECNRCTCVDGRAVCTTKFCGQLPVRPAIAVGHKTRLGPRPTRPAVKPDCQGDPTQDAWFKDCNRCTCRNGVAACTKRLCRQGEERSPSCEGNPSWKKDCNLCHCNNGTPVCTTKYCGNLGASQQSRGMQVTIVKQDRKPVCEYGSRWRVGCNWCSCHNGMARCTLKACLDQSSGSGEPECEGDSTWKQDCNWCTCGQGLALCTRMACLKPVEEPCVEGSSWRDGCNTCRCSQGFVLCTKRACPEHGQQIECQGESCGPSQLPELCQLPAVRELIRCTGFFMNWSFSATDGECKQIVYGGCGGTENLFDTEEQCKAACPSRTTTAQIRHTFAGSKKPGVSERCQLPEVGGPCFGAFPRYAYNTTSGQCQEFLYGGCAGNGNNFETEQECEAECVDSQVAPCDKSKCPWALWDHYLAKECVPQYSGDACCPTSFQCPSASESGKDLTKCYYKGASYSTGDTIPVEDPCSASCRCVASRHSSGPPEIVCANVECPELFRPPRPGCRPLYREDSCCSYDTECDDPDSPAVNLRSESCSWQNKTYKEGSKMYFDDYPCQSCICGPGFTGPTGPGCSKINCGLDFRYISEMHRGCTPINFETSCCPIDWMCPGDSRIDSQQQQQQQPQSTDESAVCHLGDQRLAVGQVLGLTDCKIECRCLTPPELTCVQYRTCEFKQEAAAQRACAPLKCSSGCHPVVGSPGQCPTCSCSSEIFSCPAQTCPSNCRLELDLQTGCPSCKCQCAKELVCPTGCPSHTVLDEATGCPHCACQPGSPQACPVYPEGKVPCPQDCGVIKAVDENGCEVCKCNPDDPGNPFIRPPTFRDDQNTACRTMPDGRAPCPMDCAIIRRTDENGCEVCECDPDNPGHPFGPLVIQNPVFCPGKGQAPCPMDCGIIRRMDESGCEVCECDPNDTETPWGYPDPPPPFRDDQNTACRTMPDGRAPCPMDCAIIRRTDENGCEVCECDPDNPGHPFGPPPSHQRRGRRSCPDESQAPCPMDCAIIRYTDENGCGVCKCDPKNPGNPFGPFDPPF